MGTTAEKKEIERLTKVIERLGSMEAFEMSRAVTNGPADKELSARIDYARAALKPPGPEHRNGDPVYVDDNERGTYLWPSGDEGYHVVAVNQRTLVRYEDEIRPAPYRIRLRPDDRAPKDEPLKAVFIGLSPERYLLEYVGKSAQVELVSDP